MNREIKFRAWDNTHKKMSFDSENNFTSMDLDDVTIYTKHSSLPNGSILVSVYDDTRGITDYEMIHDGFLMLYTGLKDKNGVEIYEGDVCDFGDEIAMAQVIYKEGMFVFNHGNTPVKNWLTHIEVIGNIYENPELLK